MPITVELGFREQNHSRMKIKVLHVVHWPRSGIVGFLNNFFLESKNQQFEYHILFFVRDLDSINEFRKCCASADYLDFEQNKIRALLKYCWVIHNISPNIIHTHSFQPGLWARLLTLHNKKIKLFSTIHSPYPYLRGSDFYSRIKRVLEISSINLFNSRVICISDNVKDNLTKYTMIKSEKLQVIKNSISIKNYSYNTNYLKKLKIDLSIDNESKIIITVGRLSEEKGLDVLLEAFAIVIKAIPKMVLIMIGDGPLDLQLKKLARKLNINDKVKFLGFKKDIYQYLLISDLYVCSSIFEGISTSILEAFSQKVPVIATHVGGNPEIIENNINGILIEPNNPMSLAGAIVDLFSTKEKINSFKANGFKKVTDEFDIKNVIREYEGLYLKFLYQ